jgi:hypothetical protein
MSVDIKRGKTLLFVRGIKVKSMKTGKETAGKEKFVAQLAVLASW